MLSPKSFSVARPQLRLKKSPTTPPKMPFVLGNSYYKPSEISKFNGRRVHFVWDRNMIQNGFLRVVTDRDEYRAFLAGSVQPKSTESTEYIPYSHVPGAGHTFYQHINFGGYVLNLAYRHAYPDLTKVTMSGFWFWPRVGTTKYHPLRRVVVLPSCGSTL